MRPPLKGGARHPRLSGNRCANGSKAYFFEPFYSIIYAVFSPNRFLKCRNSINPDILLRSFYNILAGFLHISCRIFEQLCPTQDF